MSYFDENTDNEPQIIGLDGKPLMPKYGIRDEDRPAPPPPPGPQVEIGPLKIQVGATEDGQNVMIDLGKQTHYMLLSPSQALDLAQVLQQIGERLL